MIIKNERGNNMTSHVGNYRTIQEAFIRMGNISSSNNTFWYLQGPLGMIQLRLLESLENWHWGNKLTDWNARFNELKEYVSKFKEIPTVSDRSELGYWCGRQRNAYRQNKLSKERIDLLQGIDGWFWDYRNKINSNNI